MTRKVLEIKQLQQEGHKNVESTGSLFQQQEIVVVYSLRLGKFLSWPAQGVDSLEQRNLTIHSLIKKEGVNNAVLQVT